MFLFYYNFFLWKATSPTTGFVETVYSTAMPKHLALNT